MMAKWMEYYVDCQVPLECRKNVIKTQKTLIRAWYVNSWEAVLVSPNGSDFALPQCEKKNDLPIAMSRSIIISRLPIWLSDNLS